MADVSELETRIAGALDRISGGVEKLSRPAPPPPAPEPVVPETPPASDAGDADLREALEAERSANSQLEERIRALKEKHAAELSELQARYDEMQGQARAVHERNRGLKRRVEEMRLTLEQARGEGESAITDPHLINRTMMAELETLRALRRADRTELDTLLEKLKPLVEEAADA